MKNNLLNLKKINFLRIGIKQILNVDLHIGSKIKELSCLNYSFIYGYRYKIIFLKINLLLFNLRISLFFLTNVISKRGKILFVDFKNDFFTDELLLLLSRKIKQFCLYKKWICGFLTNYKKFSFYIYKIFSKRKNNVNINIWKPFLINFKKNFKGIKGLFRIPDIIITPSISRNKECFLESFTLGIPIIGMINVNKSITGVTFPIISNENSLLGEFYFLDVFCNAIQKGYRKEIFKYYKLINLYNLIKSRKFLLKKKFYFKTYKNYLYFLQIFLIYLLLFYNYKKSNIYFFLQKIIFGKIIFSFFSLNYFNLFLIFLFFLNNFSFFSIVNILKKLIIFFSKNFLLINFSFIVFKIYLIFQNIFNFSERIKLNLKFFLLKLNFFFLNFKFRIFFKKRFLFKSRFLNRNFIYRTFFLFHKNKQKEKFKMLLLKLLKLRQRNKYKIKKLNKIEIKGKFLSRNRKKRRNKIRKRIRKKSYFNYFFEKEGILSFFVFKKYNSFFWYRKKKILSLYYKYHFFFKYLLTKHIKLKSKRKKNNDETYKKKV